MRFKVLTGAFATLAFVAPLHGAKMPAAAELVPYTYTIDRRDTEKKPLSLVFAAPESVAV